MEGSEGACFSTAGRASPRCPVSQTGVCEVGVTADVPISCENWGEGSLCEETFTPPEPNFSCNDILSYKSVLAICAARSILDLMTF